MTHRPIRLLTLAVLAAMSMTSMDGMAIDLPTKPAASPSAALQIKLETLARRALPATLGVAVLDLGDGRRWQVNADRAYPMMSVFKAPIAAAVLAGVDRGQLSMDQWIEVTRADWQEGSAVPSIGARFQGPSMRFKLRELLIGAVSQSDNTAANALLRVLGGPSTVTGFLREHGIGGMRVDLDEHGVSAIFAPSPRSEENDDARLRRGFQAFLVDPRNTSTPAAAIDFLRLLDQGRLLSPASTRQLLAWMSAQTTPNRLRAGAPDGVQVADKTGTSGSYEGRTAAYNDIAILHWPDGHTVLLAVFLSDSRQSHSERDRLFAELSRTVAAATHPGH